MSWFKVDDRFPTSPKVMRIPREARLSAVGLWTMAGAWSASQEQDGRVPAFMVAEWCPDGTIAGHLVTAGLWVETEDGYAFHDWQAYQPTRADNDARREAERLRKEKWRQQKAEKSRQSHEVVPVGQTVGQTPDGRGTDGSVPSIPTRPDPTPIAISNEIATFSSEVAVATPRPDVEQLLDLLDAEITRNGCKVPKRTKGNRDAMRLMIDRDGHAPEQIAAAIRWCQRDEFWRANVLSAQKLREKYDQLRLTAQRQQVAPNKAQQRQAESLANVAQLAALDAARERGIAS